MEGASNPDQHDQTLLLIREIFLCPVDMGKVAVRMSGGLSCSGILMMLITAPWESGETPSSLYEQ